MSAPRLTALVVDDSAAMRKQLGWALQRVFGMSPVEATDGADAWRKLSAGRYDIVITTEGAEADRQRAMALGASTYLVKPVQSQQVVEAVRQLLQLA